MTTHRRLVVVATMVGCVAISGPIQANDTTLSADDITQRVETRLSQIGLLNLVVRVTDETVTLKGTVPSVAARRQATAAAHGVPGVRWVVADVVISDVPIAPSSARASEPGLLLSDVFRECAREAYAQVELRSAI